MSDPNKNNHKDKLRPHVYDGIQEYDNRLPNWWLWTFYGAVIVSVIYWFSFYNAEVMKSDQQVIGEQMAAVEKARLEAMGELSDEVLWQMSRNADILKEGKAVYTEKCIACHGPDLTATVAGGVKLAGVSLVDAEWKWGNNPMSVYKVVTDGSPDKTKGMQSWVNELGPQKVSQVVAYLLSYHSEQEMAAATTLNEPIGM